MDNYFLKVKEYLLDLNVEIDHEDSEESVFVVSHEDDGIKNMVLGIAEPIIILEQFIFELKQPSVDVYKSLLQKNRDMISGAFVLDESGTKVLFRDTLAIENLDLNELEGSFNALSLVLSEYSNEIIRFSKN
ncbi:MAG: molecular chaperone Tir [Bacteroidota bacterium]